MSNPDSYIPEDERRHLEGIDDPSLRDPEVLESGDAALLQHLESVAANKLTNDHETGAQDEVDRAWDKAIADFFDARGSSHFYGLSYLHSKDPKWIDGFRESAAAFQEAGARKERLRGKPKEATERDQRAHELLTDIDSVASELTSLKEKWSSPDEYVAWAQQKLLENRSSVVREVLLGFGKAAYRGGDKELGTRVLTYLALELNDRAAKVFLNEAQEHGK